MKKKKEFIHLPDPLYEIARVAKNGGGIKSAESCKTLFPNLKFVRNLRPCVKSGNIYWSITENLNHIVPILDKSCRHEHRQSII